MSITFCYFCLKKKKSETRYFNSSAIAKKRLNKVERSKFNLDEFLKQVLIGNILADVYMRSGLCQSVNANSRIIFRQGSTNTDYLLHLYDLFKEFALNPPSITTIIDKDTKKSRYNLSFATLSLPCFNEFYDLFYFEGRKRVPLNISKYLTKVSLAYLIMDQLSQGGFTGNGLKLYTNAFKIEDLNLLIEALNKNFGLKATINKTSISNQLACCYASPRLSLRGRLPTKVGQGGPALYISKSK